MKKVNFTGLLLLRSTLAFLTILVSIHAYGDDNFRSIKKLFLDNDIQGSIVIASDSGELIEIHNIERAKTRFSPASTFKIVNTLIGLKSAVINSMDSKFIWDGTDRGVPIWNQDQTLDSAFKISCVWCYQTIADKVGLSTYQQELNSIGYGNNTVGEQVDKFWLNDDLKISAMEQIDVLEQLVNSTLPYDENHIEILKKIMLMEKNPTYHLYAKSGWTGPELAVGWYVGYIEAPKGIYLFAMNMHMDDIKQAPLRKKLTIESFRALGLI